jgi:sacsin
MLHACMALLLSCRVGFNSVYHVTDLPGFVSGEHLVFFDPHCKYLPSISAANPGKKINFVAHPVNSKLADQVAPFHFFGCDTRQAFSGTLFRFPLRTQQQADASTISKQVGQRSRLGFQQNRVWSMAAVC